MHSTFALRRTAQTFTRWLHVAAPVLQALVAFAATVAIGYAVVTGLR